MKKGLGFSCIYKKKVKDSTYSDLVIFWFSQCKTHLFITSFIWFTNVQNSMFLRGKEKQVWGRQRARYIFFFWQTQQRDKLELSTCNAIREDSASLSTRSLGLRKIKGFICWHNKMHSFGKKNRERWDSTGRYEMESLCGATCISLTVSLFWFFPLLKCPNGQILLLILLFPS